VIYIYTATHTATMTVLEKFPAIFMTCTHYKS